MPGSEAVLTAVSQLVIAGAALGVLGTAYAVYSDRLKNAEAALTGSLLVGAALLAAVVMTLVTA